jgi:RNA-binding protein
VELTSKQRRWLRGQAHGLDALVQVGKSGLSDGIMRQTDETLERHELIKVRFTADRDERAVQAAALAKAMRAELVGSIGRVAVIFRQNEDPEKRRYDVP